MADYMINGDDCQECGEYIGPGDGFPRSCAACKPRKAAPVMGGKKSWPYLAPTNSKLPVHIVNPKTNRTYCQAENNATWPLFREKALPMYRRFCKNCEGLRAREAK